MPAAEGSLSGQDSRHVSHAHTHPKRGAARGGKGGGRVNCLDFMSFPEQNRRAKAVGHVGARWGGKNELPVGLVR